MNQVKNRIPLTKIQKLAGEKMLKSKKDKPCFYIESKSDVTELMTLRHKLKKTLGIKITTNTFYIRAMALAVKKYPVMAGALVHDNIKIADRINIGFAVNAPQGLVVPVIKEADKKTLAEIGRLEKTLTQKARSNKLTLEEMKDETIALSNLGAYGVDSFIAIVPPLTSAILAVGNVFGKVSVKDGRAMARRMVSLSLAVDRRIINSAYAAGFLNLITERLQNPQQLT